MFCVHEMRNLLRAGNFRTPARPAGFENFWLWSVYAYRLRQNALRQTGYLAVRAGALNDGPPSCPHPPSSALDGAVLPPRASQLNCEKARLPSAPGWSGFAFQGKALGQLGRQPRQNPRATHTADIADGPVQSRRVGHVPGTSSLSLRTDIVRPARLVRFVPRSRRFSARSEKAEHKDLGKPATAHVEFLQKVPDRSKVRCQNLRASG